jgi:hypothetical protein
MCCGMGCESLQRHGARLHWNATGRLASVAAETQAEQEPIDVNNSLLQLCMKIPVIFTFPFCHERGHCLLDLALAQKLTIATTSANYADTDASNV